MTFTKARDLAVFPYSSNGAAIYVSSTNSLTITNAVFKDLESRGGLGGAICAYGDSITIMGCTFENTITSSMGGAVFATGETINISNYTSNHTIAMEGGSLYIRVTGGSAAVSISDAVITDSQATHQPNNYIYGGGGISIGSVVPSTVEFTNVEFKDVKALGIVDAGGAIFSIGPSSNVLNGVSFTNCTAPRGSILSGFEYGNINGSPAYTIKSGCKVDGVPITSTADLDTVLPSPSMRYLTGGSTIEFLP
jgi:hypothetical protein